MSVPRWVSAWLPVLLLEMAILFLSSRSGLAPQVGVPHLDKVAHLLEYAALGALLFRAFRISGGRPRESVLATWSLVALLALGDEALQSRVPGRDSSLADWFADLVGAGIGIWAAALMGRRLGRGWGWSSPAKSRP